ncbi:hypothetical protein C8R43DRAFT_1139061 [Mycena crocata]|nr:hypothetical protein C8R43DRAFT_1139061 [Mycena crocata]
MATRYMGPMVVVRRTKGGSYLVCELDGSMYHGKIAQFRVVPFEQRTSIDLPGNILDLIDLSKEKLDELAEDDVEPDEYLGKDMQFHKIRIKPGLDKLVDDEEDSDSESYMSDEVLEADPNALEGPTEEDAGPRRSRRLAS